MRRNLLRILLILISTITICSCHSTEVYQITEVAKTSIEKGEEIATVSDINALALWSFLIGISITIIIGSLAFFLYRIDKQKWDRFWKWQERHLPWHFAIVWFAGFCVYLVGTSIIDDNASLWQTILCLTSQFPMAIVHAFEMFVLESDVSAIHGKFHESLWFMSFFSLVHFFAAAVSTIFIIKYFGYNIFSKLRLAYTLLFRKNADELYVFWGLNEASYHLAKDIQRTYTSGKKTGSYKIVIVNTAEEDGEKENEHSSVGRLFNFLSYKNEELDRYKELGCLTINVFHKLSDVFIEDNVVNLDIIRDRLDCYSLARLILGTNLRTHIFLLGNNEEENIIGTSNLCRDSTIEEFTRQKKNINIYCHARYDSINRVVEDKYSSEYIDVKVIDSSHGSINILRSKAEYHPVNLVDIDTTDNLGTVKSTFTSLVIGFGETGRDAVRYLYEYGAFVHNNSSMSDVGKRCGVWRSSFNCYVIDKDADRIGGLFFTNAPAIKGVDLWNVDINSPAFYEKIKSIAQKVNYVVLALGNDELNITTAVRLYNYIRRHRADMSKLKIFVRCHNHDQKTHLQNIADHYNEKAKGQNHEELIIIFGTTDQLYTYEQIIENDFQYEGIQYNKLYCEASGKKGDKDIWESRHKKLIATKTLNELSELRRKEAQDIANAYHAQTKLLIMQKVAKERGLVYTLNCLEGIEDAPVFIREGQQIVSQRVVSDDEQLLFRNLARLEHLRWNAAHEILGYQNYKDGDPNQIFVPDEGDRRHGCNETFKLHNCLIPWQDLEAEMNDPNNEWHPDYKLYDYIVVTTTFMMQNKRKKEIVSSQNIAKI